MRQAQSAAEAQAADEAANQEVQTWLQGAKLDAASIQMLADPVQGFTMASFEIADRASLTRDFPNLRPGQLNVLLKAIDALKS